MHRVACGSINRSRSLTHYLYHVCVLFVPFTVCFLPPCFRTLNYAGSPPGYINRVCLSVMLLYSLFKLLIPEVLHIYAIQEQCSCVKSIESCLLQSQIIAQHCLILHWLAVALLGSTQKVFPVASLRLGLPNARVHSHDRTLPVQNKVPQVQSKCSDIARVHLF